MLPSSKMVSFRSNVIELSEVIFSFFVFSVCFKMTQFVRECFKYLFDCSHKRVLCTFHEYGSFLFFPANIADSKRKL